MLELEGGKGFFHELSPGLLQILTLLLMCMVSVNLVHNIMIKITFSEYPQTYQSTLSSDKHQINFYSLWDSKLHLDTSSLVIFLFLLVLLYLRIIPSFACISEGVPLNLFLFFIVSPIDLIVFFLRVWELSDDLFWHYQGLVWRILQVYF